jgi:tetratricopeptide (TPR) repeat protein
MIPAKSKTSEAPAERLAAAGYWAARAAKSLAEAKTGEAISICREHLPRSPRLASGHAIYAGALMASGQSDLAAEEFRKVLAIDPDHQVALKALGDIAFDANDTATALAYYHRILELDPGCLGLKSRLAAPVQHVTRTVTLTRPAETSGVRSERPGWEIPFYTETIGDLYLAQGHPRLAADVFRHLSQNCRTPRLADKLALAESKIKEKES